MGANTDNEPTRLKTEPRVLGMKSGVIIESESLPLPTSDSPNQFETSPLHKTFSQPPPEILHLIFERTIPPYFMLDSSASFCLAPLFLQVLRQKRSLINVCWAWYHAALPFLYESVSIRYVYQLTGILRTLVHATRGSNVKDMIKIVDIYCHVPEKYGHHFQRQVEALFRICPRAVSCNFGSRLPPTTSIWPAMTNITHLSLPDSIEISSLESILSQICLRIISLSFRISESHPVSILMAGIYANPKHFPALKSLSISFNGGAAQTLDVVLQSWTISRLENLMFKVCAPRIHPFPVHILTKICTLHGMHVRYLHLIIPRNIDIQPLLDACPALEHLVLSEIIKSLAHARVRWLDVWAKESDRLAARKEMEDHSSGLRALERVRVLSDYLRDNTKLVDVPLLIPPWMVVDAKNAFECSFLHLGVKHEVGELRFVQPEWSLDEDENVEEEEDGEYVPGLSDSCLDIDSDFGINDGSERDSSTECDEDGDRVWDTDWDSPRVLGEQNDVDALEMDFSWMDSSP
ncbi:hypothetical protein GALMADRAFT_137024 [Galerina marginata CBS 339.88]|uniref:F-box domain-containing protein n=1 Tax=Galerina marginata (strain CBS 339.88) TaxID=685588 RepID=A0A067T9U1_GALM3|nr:hypothetical protein GALMADRAFT_137024 [Galerina marginata CBS 339.88]